MKLLIEGDVIELNKNHIVYAEIPKHFAYSNCKGDFSLTTSEVSLNNEIFSYLIGKYIVVKTELTGGDTGHGKNDYYPDGHKVTCESVDGNHIVSFYQTGCFTVMNTNIESIGRAERTWKIISS